MILKESLLELIKSLTSSEKRYLKVSRELKEQNNYVRLFNCYDSMTLYNSELIQKEFEGEIILKQIHVTENYLYKTILKELRNFHSESSVEFEIRNQLNEVEILYGKGLYQQCRSLLKQIEKTAKKFESHLALIEIYNWYSELRQVMPDNKAFPEQLNIFQQELNSLNAHKNSIEYKKVSAELFFNLQMSGMFRDKDQLREIEKLILSSLLQSESKAFTFHSKLSFYQLHSVYQTIKGDTEKAISFQQKVVSLLESNPHQVQRKPIYYLISMNNLAIGFTKTQQYEEALLAIQKLRNSTSTFHIKNTSDWQARLFTITSSLELDVYLKSENYPSGIELMPEIQKGIEKLKSQISPVHILQFNFSFACLLFGEKRHKDALRWINKLLNNPNRELRPDIYCCSRMLQMIIYYELKDFEALPYAIINTSRFLKSEKKLYKAETALLAAMRKLEDAEGPKEKQLLEKLSAAFDEIFKDPLESHLLENFNFSGWVKNRIKII